MKLWLILPKEKDGLESDKCGLHSRSQFEDGVHYLGDPEGDDDDNKANDSGSQFTLGCLSFFRISGAGQITKSRCHQK